MYVISDVFIYVYVSDARCFHFLVDVCVCLITDVFIISFYARMCVQHYFQFSAGGILKNVCGEVLERGNEREGCDDSGVW